MRHAVVMAEGTPKTPALLSLVTELVDDLGTLIAGHLKLARAELAEDARSYGRRGAFVAVAAALAFGGYALACVAAALALTPRLGAPLAFLVVGGVHLLGGGVGLGLLLARAPAPPRGASLSELDRTVAALSSGAADARRLTERPSEPAPERIEPRGLS